jgi:glycosyltransferase involved in cell wall biosynthesis
MDNRLTIPGHKIIVHRRRSDWGKHGMAKYLHHAWESIRVLYAARGYDALVLVTVGIEAFFAGRLRKWICQNVHLVVADPLLPKKGMAVRFVQRWLRMCDRIVVIRRGDINTLVDHFGLRTEMCIFAHFPGEAALLKREARDEGYIYSAGWAHRDWDTLSTALGRLPYRAVVSTGVPFRIPNGAQDRVHVLPMKSPEEGRALMSAARIAVISLHDTNLPSGPLILLDAMSCGKAVVVSDVNGTRDYVENGLTALIVAPGDADAMATAITRLMEDVGLRTSIGQAARRTVQEHFSISRFLQALGIACEAAVR